MQVLMQVRVPLLLQELLLRPVLRQWLECQEHSLESSFAWRHGAAPLLQEFASRVGRHRARVHGPEAPSSSLISSSDAIIRSSSGAVTRGNPVSLLYRGR